VYTGDVFLMQYAKVFNEPSLLKEAMQQIQLVQEHNVDQEKGLLYHGWDESGNNIWANEETGTSKEFWSMGIAWYYLGLLECIDYVPLEDLARKELGTMFRELTKNIQKFEDPKTALWYQVMNKSYEPRNWIETSASAMFAYGFAKGFNKGILDKTYQAAAQKVLISLQREYVFVDDQGHLYFDGTAKEGTLDTKKSKGDLDYYVSTERRINDYKGLAALLYLSMELD
jgi:unsaturated rhamnogalacturonyl hydrolase